MSAKQSHRKARKFDSIIPLAGGLLLIGLAILIMAWSRGTGSTDLPSSVVPFPVHFAAPELSLQTVDGRTASLADYREDVVLVNNWATWCPPCKAEMPTLEAYYKQHYEEGFTIIAIEAGGESAEVVSSFVQSYRLTFPIWLDPEGASLRAFKNNSLPNSYVIDRSGMVRYAWTGEISQAMLEKYITPLLKEDH